jgi:hypothetical protein
MSDWYDPYSDEQQSEGDNAYGWDDSTVNPWLPPTYSNAKWNFGAQLPQGADQVNKQFTAISNYLKTLKDPVFNQMVSNNYPEAGAFDYGAFVPGGGVTGQDAGFDLDALGQTISQGIVRGMGGGTGAAAGKWDPYYDTSALDAAAKSGDPVIQGIAKAVKDQDAYSIKAGLIGAKDPKTGQPLDPERLKVYNAAVDELSKVATGASRNLRMGQEAGLLGSGETPKAGPLAQAWAKTGMPDPSQTYGPDNLPPDMAEAAGRVANNPFIASQRAGLGPMVQQYQGLKALYDKVQAGIPVEMGESVPGGLARDYWEKLAKSTKAPVQPTTTAGQQMQNRAAAGPRFSGAGGAMTGGGMGPIGVAPHGYTDPATEKWAREHGWSPGGENTTPIKLDTKEYRDKKAAYDKLQGMGTAQAIRNAIYTRAKNSYQNVQQKAQYASDVESGARKFIADQVSKQGRTPAKDRQNAQLAMLRQLGIGV